jgi:acyl carrier protein
MIAEVLCCHPSMAMIDTHLVESLAADPLDLVDIIVKLECEYDIKISDEDAQRFDTVGDIMDYLKNRGISEQKL